MRLPTLGIESLPSWALWPIDLANAVRSLSKSSPQFRCVG